MAIYPTSLRNSLKGKTRHQKGFAAITLLVVVCVLALSGDEADVSRLRSVIVTNPRHLTIASESKLKPGQALVHASKGVCAHIECRSPGNDIPKTIWMLWDTGFDDAPDVVKRSYDSWKEYNPEWTVKGIDLSEAELLTEVNEIGSEGYLPGPVWTSMSIQAKSDYIRISLLHKYGGIWADASLYCNQPLDDWIDLDRDYLFYLRDEQSPDSVLKLYPWYSSWWMAAPKESHAAEILYNRVIHFLRNQGYHHHENFWFHRIISSLWNNDKHFVNAIGPSESAKGPQCMLGSASWVDQHMFKSCARATIREPFDLDCEKNWKDMELNSKDFNAGKEPSAIASRKVLDSSRKVIGTRTLLG
jgi:hypothetical protein